MIPVEESEKRGLSCAVGTNNSEDLTRREIKTDWMEDWFATSWCIPTCVFNGKIRAAREFGVGTSGKRHIICGIFHVSASVRFETSGD